MFSLFRKGTLVCRTMGEASVAISSISSQQAVKADDQVGRATQRIHRIPHYLHRDEKQTGESFYGPQLVSLGPLHFGQPKLAKYETIKENLLERLPNKDRFFEDLIDRMVQRDREIRQCYGSDSGACAFEDRELGSIMARDGLFLLQFLRQISRDWEASGHISHSSTCLNISPIPHPLAVKGDIMKLENQIPILALHVISDWETTTNQKLVSEREVLSSTDEKPILHVKPEAGADGNLNSILRHALHSLSPFGCTFDRKDSEVLASQDSFLLEFVYQNIISASNSTGYTEHGSDDSSPNAKSKRKKDIRLPRAVELERRGVKFSSVTGLLDEIRFDDRSCTIYLPIIELDDRTNAVMRNLLAFEADIHKGKEKPLRCYVELMDRLINNAEDVELLANAGIIDSRLGSDEEVAHLFNGMGKILQKGKYKPIDTAIEKAIKFYTSKHRIIWGEFKKKYFSEPWVVLAVIAACISLISSLMQTYFSWRQWQQVEAEEPPKGKDPAEAIMPKSPSPTQAQASEPQAGPT